MVDQPGTWHDALARKAVASGALIRDERARVLLVEPTYKPTWEIPGGMVEAGESGAAGCARELREELGVDVPVGRLLCLDWAAPVPGRGDGVRLIYDGGVLASDTVLRLPAQELASARFVALDQVDELCAPRLTRRVRAAVIALQELCVVELEEGMPGLGERSPQAGGEGPTPG